MADDYHNQIKKVQNFNSYRYYKSKEINFQKEFEQIKANYEIEIKEVKLFFKERINAFEQRAKTNENDIIVLHRLELEKYIAQLDQSISKTVKYSKKYLDIKQKEINAVKSENYLEANYLRSQADELEKEERENANRNI
jgi:phosphoribosylanthranilate isomerase